MKLVNLGKQVRSDKRLKMINSSSAPNLQEFRGALLSRSEQAVSSKQRYWLLAK
jgi:hypothetical protein